MTEVAYSFQFINVGGGHSLLVVHFNPSRSGYESKKLIGCHSEGIFSWIQLHATLSEYDKHFLEIRDVVFLLWRVD